MEDATFPAEQEGNCEGQNGDVEAMQVGAGSGSPMSVTVTVSPPSVARPRKIRKLFKTTENFMDTETSAGDALSPRSESVEFSDVHGALRQDGGAQRSDAHKTKQVGLSGVERCVKCGLSSGQLQLPSEQDLSLHTGKDHGLECKYDGCRKTFIDLRDRRRHTLNSHTNDTPAKKNVNCPVGCFTKTPFQKKKLLIPSRLPIGHI